MIDATTASSRRTRQAGTSLAINRFAYGRAPGADAQEPHGHFFEVANGPISKRKSRPGLRSVADEGLGGQGGLEARSLESSDLCGRLRELSSPHRLQCHVRDGGRLRRQIWVVYGSQRSAYKAVSSKAIAELRTLVM